jgi:hypothetical protein
MINLIVDLAKEEHKKRFYNILKKLKPVRYVFEIKQFRKVRSVPQNKYYWGTVLEILSNETGHHKDEIHEILKKKFNPKVIVLKKTGEEFLIGGTTTEMETLEFENYLEKVRTWALSELDIYIPLPNEELELKVNI